MLPTLQQRYPDLRVEVRETQTRSWSTSSSAASSTSMHAGAAAHEAEIETDGAVRRSVPAGGAGERCPAEHGHASTPRDIDQERLILLEEGHCLRDQALAFCAGAGAAARRARRHLLATVMQMVANGYGVTLVPQIAVDVEVRDERVKLLRFAIPQPGRTDRARLAAHLAAQVGFHGARRYRARNARRMKRVAVIGAGPAGLMAAEVVRAGARR